MSTGQISVDPADRVRVVVIGDNGVGKTSLVHVLCHDEPLKHFARSGGFSVDVKLHEYKGNHKNYWVEFVDVFGTAKHSKSRNIFYSNVNGIILVHDLSNRKSYYNLWRWMEEVLDSEAFKDGERVGPTNFPSTPIQSGHYKRRNNEYDFELTIGESRTSIPVLIVGNKEDLTSEASRPRRYSIADEFGGECVNTCAITTLSGSTSERIGAFFDKVIERKFGDSLYRNNYASTPSRSASTGTNTSFSPPGSPKPYTKELPGDHRRRLPPSTGSLYGAASPGSLKGRTRTPSMGRPGSPMRDPRSNPFFAQDSPTPSHHGPGVGGNGHIPRPGSPGRIFSNPSKFHYK
ncbi:P-loop containing nucleoside triphosphate hydrolase protein [Basidiobolus meristosporus CBS 931.73]|uniref:p-loop containing nucleoside triphosphate hydrolase protein n=1 Tax=Basidiobolus meristosporus CBS 931.73 TaxID=1314790 RepID=A0A1Y1YKC7_9FUNG|nr:P-loop containing nucleoside triphosphate hydrolase protein [Basidiobolus meristosporus CBS 931.73]|eukprot:ORX98206.1 P-loop containing nucleoside triphosphate hydrolase protein [Basidiobolus meristosporus CBS 931.73]